MFYTADFHKGEKMGIINKIIFSIPVILIALYIFMAIGICLIIARQFVLNKKWYNTSTYLIVIGIVIYIANFVGVISNFGIDLINYANILLGTGIVFLMIAAVLSKISEKIVAAIKKMFNKQIEMDYKINKENDLKIKEKQLRSKYTTVVKCDNCGADNILTAKTGVCKYCRTVLGNEDII